MPNPETIANKGFVKLALLGRGKTYPVSRQFFLAADY